MNASHITMVGYILYILLVCHVILSQQTAPLLYCMAVNAAIANIRDAVDAYQAAAPTLMTSQLCQLRHKLLNPDSMTPHILLTQACVPSSTGQWPVNYDMLVWPSIAIESASLNTCFSC